MQENGNAVSQIKSNVFHKSWDLLSLREKRHLFSVVLAQLLLSFLDLIAVAAVGVLGTLAVTGVQSVTPSGRVVLILNKLHLSNFSFQKQVAIIALTATALLVFRTLMSAYLSKKLIYFMARRGAALTALLVRKTLNLPYLSILSRSSQETLFALTGGVNAITLGVLGASVSAVADFSLLIIMGIGLATIDLGVTVGTLFLFGGIAVLLYRVMKSTANQLGEIQSSLSIASNEKILEVLNSYRENFVRNRLEHYTKIVSDLRYSLADASAGMAFMPNISKYVLESAMVLGGLLLSASQFAREDAVHAVSTLAIFLTAGTRIVPAVLRLQQGAVQIKSSIGMARPTLELIENLGSNSESKLSEEFLDIMSTNHERFNPSIEIDKLYFGYEESQSNIIENLSLKIPAGLHVAIVGPSGAGKSTLVDLLLGLISPNSGSIQISDVAPRTCLLSWPGAIAYVPQDIVVLNGSIRDNICMGYPIEAINDELIWDALKVAQLADLVAQLPNRLDHEVGDRGTKLSGGQRQRLGIARAMLTKPKLLVLDEATSALDGQVELEITETLSSLSGDVTRLTIAHRLSTVRDADMVVYLSKTYPICVGTFAEVRSKVPDFDTQATLMGM